MRIPAAACGLLLAISGCAGYRSGLPEGFQAPISAQTGHSMDGFGSSGGRLHRTPVLFVHGNTESARFWLPVRKALLDSGWNPDELWAFSHGWNSTSRFDDNEDAAASIERMVQAMTQELSARSGRPIVQVDIVAHSLGVTAVRHWMRQHNAWHRVRSFVAIAGANHGVWTARADARGRNRRSALELHADSPWLAQLNADGETPGAVRVMTLYDGTGFGDALFPAPYQDSPSLQGARNLAWNREHGQHLDHLELARAPGPVAAMAEFLAAAGEPLPQATAPSVLVEGDQVRASQGELRCRADGRYPDLATPATDRLTLAAASVHTCFAHDAESRLASPMHHLLAPAAPSGGALPVISVDPPPGRYEAPVSVRLSSSDPQAMILTTSTGAAPGPGSPRYREPVYLAGRTRLRAVAVLPDGRRSAEQVLDYDISLAEQHHRHSLQSQLEGAR